MNENIYEEIKNKVEIEIDKKQKQHFIKIVANAFHKIVQVLNKVSLIIKAIPPEDINHLVLNNQKSINYKSNFFTEEQIKIYGLIQPEHEELLKARKLYNKLDISNMINFRQFYMLWGVEIQKLNINKIDCLDKLISKVKGYKKYRHKLIRKGKVKKCINCCWRINRSWGGECVLNPVLDNQKKLDYYARVHDEYWCNLWYSKHPEYKAKKFVTRVFNDLTSIEEEDGSIEI